MKAMILAAGLGTRLRPLTNNRPKALIEINRTPLLEIQIKRLEKFGFNEFIINAHHFADQIVDFIKKKSWGNLRIELSIEDELLDTGGGLKNASWFFENDEYFLLHNVDVLTNLDYSILIEAHKNSNSIATIAVRNRKTERYFLFDENINLCGWRSIKTNEEKILTKNFSSLYQLSFMGIHIISTEIFNLMTEEGKFSIVDAYLRLVSSGLSIKGFIADKFDWIDIGKLENLKSSTLIIDKFQSI
ncbi:MAG: sugar phosphate nucleotidyltransferase [Ignavibacteria bacterium]|nr:sugar phosphate nucleotidyltransferase [Ignavibacteria bacterium]